MWCAIGGNIEEHIENLGNTLGTRWEPVGNPLGTWREHVGNKGKMQKNPPPTHTKLKIKKIKAPIVNCIN
jgi:hypothetical protein